MLVNILSRESTHQSLTQVYIFFISIYFFWSYCLVFKLLYNSSSTPFFIENPGVGKSTCGAHLAGDGSFRKNVHRVLSIQKIFIVSILPKREKIIGVFKVNFFSKVDFDHFLTLSILYRFLYFCVF